jgi:hypothetical protein
VLALRAAGHSVTEIAAALTAQGLPVSAQTTWQILDAEGIPWLPRRDEGRRGPPARLEPVKAAKLPVGSLILAKCARNARVHHVGSLTDDAGLAFTLGLTALPKATHLGSYSWRVRRESNVRLLSGMAGGLRRLGLATGEDGFTATSTPSATTAKTPSWKSTTCPGVPSGPGRC